MVRHDGPIVRRDTSLGVHVRALSEVLITLIIDDAEGLPSERRVRLRNCLAALQRAYPEVLAVNEAGLAQALAELDGIPIEDAL